MADSSVEFIDCPSLSISYDIMGLASVNFTVVKNEPGWPEIINPPTSVTLNDIGGRDFTGFVTSASLTPIPNTSNWYETRVTLMSIAK
jgi:hypothetical protein